MNQNIKNFCIIAHIDHGKSTLSDRLLELTKTISDREKKDQLLDSMDLERERGITIKLAPVRMLYNVINDLNVVNVIDKKNVKRSDKSSEAINQAKRSYILNLIDTPGHVDFNYEVSRSLAAVEGAILLVDATQGVQAQTIGNLYLALEQNLTIIPVINKIDMPAADIDKTKAEIINLIGCKEEEIICVSAKTGQNVEQVLETVIEKVPPPTTPLSFSLDKKEEQKKSDKIFPLYEGDVLEGVPPRALIFDSVYDDYKGVVASVRVIDGTFKKKDEIYLMGTKSPAEILEIGYYTPKYKPAEKLTDGEIGYIVTGLKDVSECRVGDTITLNKNRANTPLPGYKQVKPMVFAGIFPKEGDDYGALRDALEKLTLNDSSLFFEPENSKALGFGFRCGFLGMLHLDIFQERLRREFGLEITITVPSVAYKLKKTNSQELVIRSPQEMPDRAEIELMEEPWMSLDVIAPSEYVGNIMNLVQERRGRYKNTEYLSTSSGQPVRPGQSQSGRGGRVMLHYEIPLASLITDFYDKLKTVSSGFASMNYEVKAYEPTKVVKLDILVAEEPVEELATLVWEDESFRIGKKIVNTLKETLPRQQFVLKIQAAIGGKVIAAERLSALRKDVTAKLYGGDVTRKRKLLEKQKKGKKRMLAHGMGKVEIPTEAYISVLKR